MTTRLVESLQSGLQHQYDLSLPYHVEQFVCHDAMLARSLSADSDTGHDPAEDADDQALQETVFICQSSDSLEFTVYLDHEVLSCASENTRTDHRGRVHAFEPDTLDTLCTVVEGVSHAVCLLWHAHHERQLRAVDMELQAEVDKYLLLMACHPDDASRVRLHQQLFENARIIAPNNSELHARYKQASDSASVYCDWLRHSFPGSADQPELWQELARFYRLSGTAKFNYIRQLH